MKARVLVLRLCAGAFVVWGTAALGSACNLGVESLLLDVPFDGGYLGSCTDGQTRIIPPSACPGACSGPGATAICVGSSYAECTCLPSNTSFCEGGCCYPGAKESPWTCEGKVAKLDPSEGQCAAPYGYLLCNGKCFSKFQCSLPKEYSLLEAGADAPADAPSDGGVHADAESGADVGAPESGKREGGDASSDAPSTDANAEAGDGGSTSDAGKG